MGACTTPRTHLAVALDALLHKLVQLLLVLEEHQLLPAGPSEGGERDGHARFDQEARELHTMPVHDRRQLLLLVARREPGAGKEGEFDALDVL